jgi:beta-lactam-binding protein with PASTA domain
MGWKKSVISGSKIVAKQLAPDVINLGAKIGVEIIDKQKSLIKIPDLKDVHIDEAVRLMKDELSLVPVPVISKPSLEYIDGSENDVVYSVPRFGSRVNPGSTVKLYYLTQETIEKSIELSASEVKEFKLPILIGVDIYEAKGDLELLGLRVIEKLEKPDPKFIDKEDNQVTRVTYPDDKKIGTKVKTGDRIWLYFVNEQVIEDSKALKEKKGKKKHKKIRKMNTTAKDVTKEDIKGVKEDPENLVNRIRIPFINKKEKE